MKNILLSLFLFGVVFFAFDKLFIILMDRSADAEYDKRLEKVLNGEISTDILVTGSSRGGRDIMACQLEENTGLSVYNFCYPGSNVYFHRFILETFLKYNEPPRFLLLVVDDYNELIPVERSIFRKDRLYPLVKYPDIRKELANLENREEWLSRFFITFRLNKNNFDIRQKHPTPLDTIMHCGSMPVPFQKTDCSWDFDSGERLYPAHLEDPGMVRAYLDIMELCQHYRIKPVIIFPPNYQSHSVSFESRIRELSGDLASYYIYDSLNPVYTDRNYYYDVEHLKLEGAEIFTQELSTYQDSLFNRYLTAGR
jgi:hypothetical protein